MPIPREDYNKFENFGLHEIEKSILEEQDVEGDHKNVAGKNSDTESCAKDGLSGCTPQDELLANKSSLFLREIRFSEQEFPAGKTVSDIKYHYPCS